MSVQIDVVYEGGLHCTATHGPSKATVATDAPVDNHGRGESFSPTDLVGTALGACMLTIMGIVADRHKLDLNGVKVRVLKDMVQEPVRRIGRLDVVITFPAAVAAKLSETDRSRLEAGALHCPVHQSLHPDVQKPVQFVYES